MEISVVKEEDVCLVYLFGDLVFSEVSRFEKQMKQLFSELGHHDVVHPPPVLVDMTHVQFLDSAGVAVLVGIHLDSRHRLLELGYCGFTQQVRRTLDRTHVSTMLNFYSNEKEGRAALVERQRIYQRFIYNANAVLAEGETTYPVTCLNISKGGCSMFSKEFLTPNKKYDISFLDLDIGGVVDLIRCHEVAGGYQLALAFDHTSVEFQQSIVKILNLLQNQRPDNLLYTEELNPF